MIFGTQLTGLLRRNPNENLLQLEQQDFPEEKTLEVDEQYKKPNPMEKYLTSIDKNFIEETGEMKRKGHLGLFSK